MCWIECVEWLSHPSHANYMTIYVPNDVSWPVKYACRCREGRYTESDRKPVEDFPSLRTHFCLRALIAAGSMRE